jgi:hypothetical protein
LVCSCLSRSLRCMIRLFIWEVSFLNVGTYSYKLSTEHGHCCVPQILRKLGIEGMFLNMIKAIYDKPIASNVLNGEQLKPFLIKSRMRQGFVLSHSYSM